MTHEQAEELLIAARQTRVAQREYFRTRADAALHAAKGHEKQLDELIAFIDGSVAPSLFDGTFENPRAVAGNKAEWVPNAEG